MKLLTTEGLTKLIQLIKSSFISSTDIEQTSTVDIETTAMSESTNLITSGAVYAGLNSKQNTLTSDNAGENVTIVTGGSTHNLPSEYQEVTYIQGTGTQYIDTGSTTQGNDTFKYKITSTSSVGNFTIYGASSRSIATGERALFYNGTGIDIVYPTSATTGAYQSVASIYFSGNTYVVEDNLTEFKLDGTTVSARECSTAFESTYNLALFATLRSSTANYIGSFRMYYFEWYRDGVLYKQYIPCYRKSDNKVGMYETVNDEFCSSSSNTDFIKGANVTDTTKINALSGLTASVTELNYVDGVTSNIQTQLNNKSLVTIRRWS